ncbi:hypothetical protein [Nafulsella turpanensis]|uniref:hypothetical protein n=1 Tax=Nafulsella turpanensis TaxID=1265690 RepID=UPI00135F167B|nr:hypothetical protein [Nafulsella turpanensis]
MNSDFTFMAAENWRWLSLAIVLLILAFCLLAEYRQKRKRSGWRVLLLCMALFSLLMVAWKPAYWQELPAATGILLLENAEQKIYDSLQEQHPEAETFMLRKRPQGQGDWLPHISYLAVELPPESTLFLLGEGVEEQELRYLENFNVHYFPGSPSAGLQELDFPRSIALSDTFSIRGRVSTLHDTLAAVLSMAGKGVDSVRLYSAQEGFLLEHIPPLSGSFDYHLQLLNQAGDTLEYVPLRVKVEKERQPTIGLFSSFPSFESKYLKNWLAAQGYGVFYQAEMAPERWQREVLNLPEKRFAGLNKELLQQVDVLILDQSYLQNLPPALVRLLKEQLREQGLGVLVISNGSNPETLKQWAAFSGLRLGRMEEEGRLMLRGREMPLPRLQYHPVYHSGWYQLVQDRKGAAAVVYAPVGLGMVAFSSLGQTYQLLLEGEEAAYQLLWNSLLHQLLKPQPLAAHIESEFPALEGQRHHLQFWSATGEVPEVVLTGPDGNQQVLPLLQDDRLPERWHAYHWPELPGMYMVKLGEQDSLKFNVLENNSLWAWRQNKSALAIRSYLSEIKPAKPEKERQAQVGSLKKPFPLLWFYMVFLLSMAALWLEKKINPS